MHENGNKIRRFGLFEIDVERKILWVDRKPADLPIKSIELLSVLIEHNGDVVSKEELLNSVWNDSFVEEGVLPQNVYLLRKLFKENGIGEDLIQTVPRRGYRFVGELESNGYKGEVVYERETIEHQFIAAYEESESFESDTARNTLLPPIGIRRWLFTGVAIGSVVLLAFAFGPAIYRNYFQTASANTASSKLEYERLADSSRVYHMGMSPDDERVAYSVTNPEGKNSLVLRHMPTGSETVIVKPQDLAFNSIQISPDGNFIYYLARREAAHIGVFRIPIYGGQPTLVTKDLIDYFSVSPDGEWLAFYRIEDSTRSVFLEICRSTDGSDRRTVTVRSGNDSFRIWGVSPAWSPDGRKLVSPAITKLPDVRDPRNFLVETDLETGAQSIVKGPDWFRIGQARWNKSGLTVLASEKKGDPWQIWKLDPLTGEARNLTADNNDYRTFQPSRNGQFMTAISWVRTVNLFLIPLDDPTQIRQLTHDTATINGGFGLKWTNDGKYIVYGNGKNADLGNIFKIDTETLDITQLTFDPGSLADLVDTTPDGRSVVFASNRSGKRNIWQIGLDGSGLTALTDGSGEDAPEVSPDGQWLYYVSDGLWKMPLGGGQAERVWSEEPEITRVSPTDPNQLISYIHDKNEKVKNAWMFVVYNLSDPSKYRNLGIDAVRHFEWKHDGTGIYYADPNEAFNNLHFLSLRDLTSRKITDYTDQRIVAMSLSPDGKTMAVARGTQHASLVKLTGMF